MSLVQTICELCGEPMPPGEEMFKYHGYSCECPKPPLPKPIPDTVTIPRAQYEALTAARDMLVDLHRLTGYVEVEEIMIKLRAAGILEGE